MTTLSLYFNYHKVCFRITLILSVHEEINYFPIHHIDPFRAQCSDFADDHVCCRRPAGGAIDADIRSEYPCRRNSYTAFSNYFSIMVFAAVVSRRLGPDTHVDKQYIMGRRDLYFGDGLEKNTGQDAVMQPLWHLVFPETAVGNSGLSQLKIEN